MGDGYERIGYQHQGEGEGRVGGEGGEEGGHHIDADHALAMRLQREEEEL